MHKLRVLRSLKRYPKQLQFGEMMVVIVESKQGRRYDVWGVFDDDIERALKKVSPKPVPPSKNPGTVLPWGW